MKHLLTTSAFVLAAHFANAQAFGCKAALINTIQTIQMSAAFQANSYQIGWI
jgi:hypothetical protein